MRRSLRLARVSTALALLTIWFSVISQSYGGLVFAHPKGGPCDTQPTGNICAIAHGSSTVQAEQPYVVCGNYNGPWNVLQGCNASNYAKWGFANNGKAMEWVSQYGWTYTGTQDGYRYFTFGNEMGLQPMVSYYYIEVSDGYWNNCGNLTNPCTFDPWQDYLSPSQSPSAQMRIWVDSINRPQNQADRYLESPKIGQSNCMGSASGSTSSTISASVGVSGGGVNATIGASDTQRLF